MSNNFNYFCAINFLYKYIKKFKSHFIMFYLGWLLDSALSFSMPIVLGIMIDEIVYYQNSATFSKIGLLYTIMCICSCIIYFVIYAQHHYLTNMYAYNIKMDVFKHFQNNSAKYLKNTSTGELISIIQNYTPQCMHFVVRNIIHTFNNMLIIIAAILYLFNIHWQIGLLTLIAAPITAFINIKTGNKIKDLSNDSKTHYRKYVGQLFDMIKGISELRLLTAKLKISKDLNNKLDKIFNCDTESGIRSLHAINIMKFANLCVKLSIFAITGYLAKSGQITLGVLTIIISFFGIIYNKLEEISRSYIDGQSRLSYIQHIDNYLNTPTENWYGNNELLIKNAKIEFKNVCFSYNDQQLVFENLSFAINPGEKVALVGKNGCGKTTLAALLIGFHPIESGEILIDDQNINSVTLKSIRQNIGVVSQEVLVFEGSIKHNLLLGNPNSSDAEINTACQQAGILDFIKSLPQGFDTVIGKNGIDLSLGQKQRLSIARTYLKNPPIIIFDEATSALDAKTELDIHKAWENTLSGRTAIIISHRISSIMMSDRVIVLENGKIVYTGPPSDALSKSAYFDWIGEKNNYDSKNQISN